MRDLCTASRPLRLVYCCRRTGPAEGTNQIPGTLTTVVVRLRRPSECAYRWSAPPTHPPIEVRDLRMKGEATAPLFAHRRCWS